MFLFDPDGNVVEISNCAPVVGQTSCRENRGVGMRVEMGFVESEGDGLEGIEEVAADKRSKTDSIDSDSCQSEE
ncbi:hypothetical protein EON65_17755 [archaeon]|nr:MAG: hypothetical protein EON65_17755 [archaeon]